LRAGRPRSVATRVLCLGNDILADDAFGIVVAEQLRRIRPDLDVCESSTSGFDLLDSTLGARRLLVVDTVQSGALAPGTVSIFHEGDVRPVPGGSPHYVGLFEALKLGRALGLAVPEEVMIIAVEPADCLTVGGDMHPLVKGAISGVLGIIEEQTRQPAQGMSAGFCRETPIPGPRREM
jgi:hydrogenase maturation protease